MSNEPSSARSSARRFGAAPVHNEAPDGAALAVHDGVRHAVGALSRTLGPSGAAALLTRAIAQVRTTHPLVDELRFAPGSGSGKAEVTASVETHGGPAVVGALESLRDALLEILGRLIGEDLVARLVELSPPNATQDDEDGHD